MSAATLDAPAIARGYRDNGFVLARGAFAASDLEPVRAAIARAIDDLARQRVARGESTDSHAGESIETRLVKLLAGEELGRSWDEPVFGHELHALIAHEAIVSRLRALLGERINFDGGYHVRPKLPDSELTSFPFHQDSQYYGAGTEHADIVSAWVPLVDVDEANGCLWLIPGSHRWGLLGGARGADLNIRTFEDVERRAKAIPIPMCRGDILFFTNLTVHGSKINRTPRVRWSIDLRYTADPAGRDIDERERASLAQYFANPRTPGFAVSGAGGPESFQAWRKRCAAQRS